MTLRNSLLFIIISVVPLTISSQNLGLNILTRNLDWLPSPQATDLGRFGEIPMSYFTGRANIVVPIISFNEHDVPLDINISYDTSGLLMNKLPGVVGPGWTLNAGGCITRVQSGLCDEVQQDYLSGHSYFNSHSFLAKDSIEQRLINDSSLESATQDPRFPLLDLSPDLFYFNFMNKTGFFFLGADGKWKVCSEYNLMVEFDLHDSNNYIMPIFSTYPKEVVGNRFQPKAIKGFHIFDEEGNKYTFGYSNESIEFTTDLFLSSDLNSTVPWVADCWYLTSVEDRFGNKLYDFEYKRGKFLVQLSKCIFDQNSFQSQPDGIERWTTSPNHFSGTLNVPTHLSKLHTASGTVVDFTMLRAYPSGQTGKRLYPSLYDSNGTICSMPSANFNQFQFFYLQNQCPENMQYWATNTYNPNDWLACTELSHLSSISIKEDSMFYSRTFFFEYDTIGRVHLSGLNISTSGTPLIGQYSFKYNDYASVPSDYLTQDFDHWGYLNSPTHHTHGNGWPYSFIESGPSVYQEPAENMSEAMSEATSTMDNLRGPDLESSKKGMLYEIIYPTGGKTELEYELNDFCKILSNDRLTVFPLSGIAGGLRIKAINDYDSLRASRPYQSRTFSYNIPGLDTSSGQLYRRPTYFWSWSHNNDYYRVSMSKPVLPLVSSDGYHIGYSYVTETLADSTRIIYHYSNFSNMTDESPVVNRNKEITNTPFYQPSELGFTRGKLLYEHIKGKDGGTIKKTNYIYRQDAESYRQDFSYASNITTVGSRSDAGCLYKIYYPKYDISKVITSWPRENIAAIDTVTYTMADYSDADIWGSSPGCRKCSKKTVVRGGNKLIVSYDYANYLNDKGFLPLRSTTTYFNGSRLSKNETQYTLFNGHYQPGFDISTLGNGVPDTLTVYNAYNNRGRLQQFTRKGEYPTRLYWSSRDRLIARLTSPYMDTDITTNEQVFNIMPFQFAPSTIPSPLNTLKIGEQSIFQYPAVSANTYVYDSRNRICASASENGLVSYYIYDALGRLTEIQDVDHNTLQRFTYHYSTGN